MPIITQNKSAQENVHSHIKWVGSQFESFQKNGTGYKALCPVHDDENPSLSINQSKDGKILLHCHAGCSTRAVLDMVGLSFNDLKSPEKRIASSYDYRDETGTLLFQVVRFSTKEFRQRKPKEGPGWIWSVKGVRRVLYRLPELCKASPDSTVFKPGGEKDADRLAAIGLVATTNSGGEGPGKWLDGYNSHLAGRHVAIIPDNDSTGWDHAYEVAESLHGIAALVKLVELPGLPEHGDVSDWLDSGGTLAKLLGIVKRTQPYNPTHNRLRQGTTLLGKKPADNKAAAITGEKPDVLPVGPTHQVANPLGVGLLGKVEVAPFPLDALPGALQQFVKSVAEALPCPVDFPGTMLLPVLGTFIGRKYCIEVKKSWREFPLLWGACVARSGERKTPAFNMVTAPLGTRQKKFLSEYIQEKSDWDTSGKEDPPPKLKQILTNDTTIEALKDVLASNREGIIYPADELSGWARSIGQYKGGRGDDKQIWLSFWSGEPIVSNRKSNPEPIVIPDPFVSIVGGIQPDALGDIIDHSREDGFSARVLFSWPDPLPHCAWSDAVLQSSVDYASICEQLWELKSSKEPVTFSAAAKDLWVAWVNQHRDESPADTLRATWSKAEGHCLRLTLILHLVRKLCNETRSPQIDEKSIKGGIKLIEYFKSHANRVYSHIAVATDDGRIAKALRWIRKHGGQVTARLAHMNGFTKDSNQAKILFDALQELGYGTVTNGKQGSASFTLTDTASTGVED